MREISLPITQTFSITIDTHNIDMSKAVDMGEGRFLVPLGNIVDENISAIVETAWPSAFRNADWPEGVEFCRSVKVKAAVRPALSANGRLGIDNRHQRSLESMAAKAE